MFHNNHIAKNLIYWVLVAWVTVAIAINPSPLLHIDYSPTNEVQCGHTIELPLMAEGGQPSVGGG